LASAAARVCAQARQAPVAFMRPQKASALPSTMIHAMPRGRHLRDSMNIFARVARHRRDTDGYSSRR